jgi:hypothetical protein
LVVIDGQNTANGYFNAYGNVARKDNVDYVVHLGDYIYEYENGVPGVDERAVVPQREIFSLYDYRTRLGQVRSSLLSLSRLEHGVTMGLVPHRRRPRRLAPELPLDHCLG